MSQTYTIIICFLWSAWNDYPTISNHFLYWILKYYRWPKFIIATRLYNYFILQLRSFISICLYLYFLSLNYKNCKTNVKIGPWRARFYTRKILFHNDIIILYILCAARNIIFHMSFSGIIIEEESLTITKYIVFTAMQKSINISAMWIYSAKTKFLLVTTIMFLILPTYSMRIVFKLYDIKKKRYIKPS